MLPRTLYELLPYLYIVTGITTASLVDSKLVLVSSILLILTGVFVFVMRRNYRKSIKRNANIGQMTLAPNVFDGHVRRSGIERRCNMATEWPFLDTTGDVVLFERRSGERRMSGV